jgi:uncharacterized protein YgiM (DUF1202 family)
MPAKQRRILLSIWLLVLSALGCNFGAAVVATPGTHEVSGVGTLSVLQTAEEMTHAAAFVSANGTATELVVAVPLSTLPTSQVALSTATTLCRSGPGAPYKVVSVMRPGERVEILGRATVGAWFIVADPIHLTPCWMQLSNLQLSPGFNASSLPLITPPPPVTPTATLLPGVTPSATRTP